MRPSQSDLWHSSFVADAVVAALRDGRAPSANVALALDRRPLVDSLRERLEAEDADWVLRLAADQHDAVAGLGVSLTRHLKSERTRDALHALWKTEGRPHLRNRVMWRLLDFAPEDIHEFERFIHDEWALFAAFNSTFFGGPDEALSRILDRIGDPTFPEGKKWVYYYCLVDVVSPESARSVISLGGAGGDARIDRARGFVAERLEDGWTVPALFDELPDAGPAYDFLAEAVLSRMRSGVQPDESDAIAVHRLPFITNLRAAVLSDDVAWILGAVEAGVQGELCGLLLSLLRNHEALEPVPTFLLGSWDGATAFQRAHLMWRILDDLDLPESWHRRICEFVFEEWDVFAEVSSKFLGEEEDIINNVLKRLTDDSFPPTKRWVYFCRLVGVSNDEEAEKALLTLARELQVDEFTREVAGRLLDRFYD